MTVTSVASYLLLGKVLLLLQPVFRHASVMQPWQCSGKKKWSLVVRRWVVICDSWTLINVVSTTVLPFLTCAGHWVMRWAKSWSLSPSTDLGQLAEGSERLPGGMAKRKGCLKYFPSCYSRFLQAGFHQLAEVLPHSPKCPRVLWCCIAPSARPAPKGSQGVTAVTASCSRPHGQNLMKWERYTLNLLLPRVKPSLILL